jgi:hypothetical protein
MTAETEADHQANRQYHTDELISIYQGGNKMQQ